MQVSESQLLRPIYSPRSTLSQMNNELDKLATNLAINIDKYILGSFKDSFQANHNQLSLKEFLSAGYKHLASWQRELPDRHNRIILCLIKLFEEADIKQGGYISYGQFNNMLIEKGLSLKSLRNEQPEGNSMMKQILLPSAAKSTGVIQKMIFLNGKMAICYQESNRINFIPTSGTQSFRPLQLSQQQLSVETLIAHRTKDGHKGYHKKQVVVANYKTVILDMIYINDGKYNMLMTSSSDCTVRGWDISSSIASLAKQPENDDEKMVHQFSTEMHAMAWDSVNEVLYCSSNTDKIYEWMVKTDSQRQLSDHDAHTAMISTMIMMPKLQFLATGGYDGKMILWDTISQAKKFKYQKHTRSIASMAFHEKLILLFTSAFDHTICVWNPYIPSLIHKIQSSVNYINLSVIPDSNFLLALDSAGNVKIREVNKFTVISSFSVDHGDKNTDPTCLANSLDPVRYYFGGSAITCYEFIPSDSNLPIESSALCIRHQKNKFKLYCPIRNSVLVWDLLTGTLANTLQEQSPSEITTAELIGQFGLMVIGDADGNLFLRKLQSGILAKKLYKHKLTVTVLLVVAQEHRIEDNMIFSASEDGEIAIFTPNTAGEFALYRSLHAHKLNPQAIVLALVYSRNKHLLVVGTNIGELYFVDIDKNRVICSCQTSVGEVQALIPLVDSPLILCFSKKAEIFGVYLPPHANKFKSACHLICEMKERGGRKDNSEKQPSIETVAVSKNGCYIGNQHGDVLYYYLGQNSLNSYNDKNKGVTRLKPEWQVAIGEPVKNIVLIKDEEVLMLIAGNNRIVFLDCNGGLFICELALHSVNRERVPLFYFNDQTNEIYLKDTQQVIPISVTSTEDKLRRSIDPAFLLKKVDNPGLREQSNFHWKYHPKLQSHVDSLLTDFAAKLKALRQFESQPKQPTIVKSESLTIYDSGYALELRDKWEMQKKESQNASMHVSKDKTWINFNKRKQQSLHVIRPTGKSLNNLDNKNPMYRLGAALRSLNDSDQKALKLMQLASRQPVKKSATKLPNIRSRI